MKNELNKSQQWALGIVVAVGIIAVIWFLIPKDSVQAKVERAEAVRESMLYHIEQARAEELKAQEDAALLDEIKKQLPIALCLEDSKNCPSGFIQGQNL